MQLLYMPRVIEFLGYNPLTPPDDVLEKLAWHKKVNGLALEKPSADMGRDSEQPADWSAQAVSA